VLRGRLGLRRVSGTAAFLVDDLHVPLRAGTGGTEAEGEEKKAGGLENAHGTLLAG
jgi:hypothetical protein